MTDTSAILSSLTSNTGTPASSKAQSQIAGNFDTFLKLLTTQLQYQDPLSPMDSNEFTAQLVQFADVEQSIAANKNLESLVNFALASATSSAVSYIGREVTAGGDAATLNAGGSAQWHYTLPRAAGTNEISVVDAAGNEIYNSQGELTTGEHAFDWDGRTSGGGTAPAGTYRIVIKAKDAGGNDIAASPLIKGIVTSVDISEGTPLLNVGGMSLKLSQIVSVGTAPPTTTN